MLDVKVGDSLFVVFRREKGFSVVVEKVGRKWIEVSGIFYRINKENGCLENSYRGKAYLREEDWLAEKEKEASWNDLRNYFLKTYSIPDNISTEGIKLMLEIINKKEV